MEATNPKDLHPKTLLGMKLIQQPFSKAPVADKLFDFDVLKQTRDTVSHHLQFSQLLLVVQGGAGSGKNSFANSLIISEHPALYFFNATAEADDSLQSLLNRVATNNKADSIPTLEKRIQDILFRGQQPVMIVNDAHLLNENVLHDLIKYSKTRKDNNQQTHLKLLLLGQPELEHKLETNGIVNHNQFYIINLPVFNVSNTGNFLMHRLTVAGYRDTNPFTDKDIKSIYAEASGNPDATLAAGADILNNKKELLEETVALPGRQKQYLLILGGLIVILGIIYNSILSSSDENDPDDLSQRLDNKMPLQQNNSAVNQLFNNSNNTMDVKQPAPMTALVPLQPAMPVHETSPIQEAETPAETALAEEAETKQPGLTEIDSTQPLIVPLTAQAETKAKPETSIAAVTPAQPAVVSKPAKPTLDATTRSFQNAGAHTPDWLLQQPSANWSLQILAGYKPEGLLSFTHQHQLRDKVAYYRTRLNNKDWHVLLYGQYKSKDEAKAAIEYLPAFIKANQPWAKDLNSVQKAIKQR